MGRKKRIEKNNNFKNYNNENLKNPVNPKNPTNLSYDSVSIVQTTAITNAALRCVEKRANQNDFRSLQKSITQ